MKIFWFSFSYKGENQGICVVEADTEEDGKEKIDNLKLTPKYDDILVQECIDLDDDPLIELNIFYSKDEMIAKGYGVNAY